MIGKQEAFPIFISYERTTGEAFAENLKEALDRIGVSAFFAPTSIQKCDKEAEVIENALYSCNIFVIILTSNVEVSEWVKWELKTALERECIIIPCIHKNLKDKDIVEKEGFEGLKGRNFVRFDNKSILAEEVTHCIKGISLSVINTQKIGKDAAEVSIARIFSCRREDERFPIEVLREIMGSKEVDMMSISLRDFFHKNAEHIDTIMGALKKGTKFKLLLLNPLSEAAKDRSIIENSPAAKKDLTYLKLPLFEDIQGVADWLNIHLNEKIEVRFSSLTPTVHMIRTDRYTFIEQYHIGDLRKVGIERKNQGVCIGGYVPVFMFVNDSRTAKLMKDHFDNAWNMGEQFKTVHKAINEFVKDPEKQRMKQLITFTLKTLDQLPEDTMLSILESFLNSCSDGIKREVIRVSKKESKKGIY